MSISREDLDRFHEFAEKQLGCGAAASISELAAQWDAARDRDEVNESIRRGIDELNAGLGRSADEVIRDLRQKHQIPVE